MAAVLCPALCLLRADDVTENKTCMSEADLLYVKQLLDTMFIGGVRFDEHGGLINGTRWDLSLIHI